MKMVRYERSGRVNYPVSLGSRLEDALGPCTLETLNLPSCTTSQTRRRQHMERPRISEWWMLKIEFIAHFSLENLA